MQLHPLILVFMCAWLGIWYTTAVPMTLFGSISPLAGLVMLGAPMLAVGIFLSVFHYEADRSHRELTQIVTGNELPQQQRMSPLIRNLLWGYTVMVIAIFLHQLLAS